MSIRRVLLSALLPLSLTPLLPACGVADDITPASDEPLAERDDAILGTLTMDGSCSATEQAFFRDATFLARTVVSSPAYEQCVRTRVASQFVPCTFSGGGGDPSLTTAQHTDNALNASRSVNDLVTNCNYDDDVWGRAGVGSTPAYYGDERFTFSQWSMQRAREIGRPMCGPGQNYETNNCREMAYPDGLREVAATVIHENMHQHGYTHGPGCMAPGYNDGVNSMPWLIDQCLVAVVQESMSRCGDICSTRAGDDISSCRNRGRLQLVDALGASTCGEVYDPGLGGLGAIKDLAGEMTAMEFLPHQQKYGGPTGFAINRTSDLLKAKGNFDPYKPGDELIFDWDDGALHNGWIAVSVDALGAGPERTASVAVREYGNLLSHWGDGGSARWLLYRDNVVLAVGRYSAASVWGTGPARDEIFLRDPNGFGVIALVGNFVTRNVLPWGTVIGGAGGNWTVGAGDVFLGQGDLNGDGQTDIILRSATRIGIITRTGTGGTFQTLDTRSIDGADGWWGYWNLGTSDQIVAVADFAGDSRDEILIRSPWGLGLLGVPAGGRTPQDLWGAPYGTVISSRWTLRATDWVGQPGHWYVTGKKQVRVRGTDGLATLRFTGSPVAASIPSTQHMPGTGGSWPDPATGGHWSYGPTSDQLLAYGDFDGDGFDSFVVKSGWGIGVIGRVAGTSSALVVQDANATGCGPTSEVACHSGLWGSWLSRETDQVLTVIDDGAGGDTLILRGRP